MTRLMGSPNATMARTISTDRDNGTKREALKSLQKKGYLLLKFQKRYSIGKLEKRSTQIELEN